ncbi:hypothetical protein A1OK_03895 [Enterovibrio norvegicus FF-454]|uniref:DUF945 domain-containing protein n=1 Tax=Enterovibrio norvegicus FF-454 TaxID=1185651 RepID=A0A1E5C0X0_9GAMM|nr:DUF945 family protein [Enterovibrio norvegicus]OEE59163.1 hypothetical protein A1OK_03895 [Enterovibrio norvegicus FF-454]
MIFGKYTAIAGAVAVGVLWPFATGQIGQSFYDNEIKQIQSPYLAVENTSYERGYLSSEVITRVAVIGSMKEVYEDEGLPTSYSVLSHVSHGFLGVSTTSTLEMTPEIKVITDLLWPSGESPLTIVTETSLLGATQYDVTVRAMNGENDEIKVTSSPANVSGTADKDGVMVFQLEMPFIELSSPEGEKFALKDITGSGDGQLVDDVWVGSQRVNVATSTFSDMSGSTVTIDKLAVDVKNALSAINNGDVKTAAPDDLRFDNTNVISFEKFDMPDTLVVDNFKMGVNFNALDYNSMIALATTADSMSAEPTEEEMMKLVTALDGLVEKGLTFEIIPLELDTPEGHIDAKFDLSVEPGLGSVTQNVGALMTKLKGNLFINVPTAYVEDVPEVEASLSNLEPYGFISQAENGVTLTAKIEGDQAVSPSGEKIPLGLLMMMLM